jgi:hypothetical protein
MVKVPLYPKQQIKELKQKQNKQKGFLARGIASMLLPYCTPNENQKEVLLYLVMDIGSPYQ